MTPRLRAASFGAALALLFGLTALFRFTALSDGFSNDHYLHLGNAQQMLFGEWPTRDFLDHGMPLMYVASATAQRWLGQTLFAEAVLVAVGFALAAALTAAAVRELTGSRALGLLAAVLEVAIVPRTYGYPKILTYAAGFLLMQRYVSRPTYGRLAALAVAVVTAFLFRHDHGIYLGLGGALAAWLAVEADGRRGGYRRALAFVGMVGLLVAPYLLYVQVYDGTWPYLQKGLEFRRRELDSSDLVLPTLGEDSVHAVLFYAYWAVPVLAAAVLLRIHRREGGGVAVARVLPMVAIALLAGSTLARTPLAARLPDAIVPFVTIGAWLVAGAWRARPHGVWRPAAALATLLAAAIVLSVGRTVEHLDRSGLLAPITEWPEQVLYRGDELRERYADIGREVLPFYEYVARCTTPEHRVLAVGFLPEVAFFTRRPFAGGQVMLLPGYYDSEPYQRAVLNKLSRESVPFVVIAGNLAAQASDPGAPNIEAFDSSFPLVAGHVRRRYVPLAAFSEDGRTTVEVLIERRLSGLGRDATTGWPCPTPA